MRFWLYRCWLLGATGLLSLFLLRLQDILESSSSNMSFWQHGIQWAELMWLSPVPLAVVLWMGWFIFAEAILPRPEPVEVPRIAPLYGFLTLVSSKPVRLVFRFVTRGDNTDVLRDSVAAVHRAFARYALPHGPYSIQIISECPIALDSTAEGGMHVYVVPKEYATKEQSRFKARALTYLQEQIHPQQEDWYIYLDEESRIDEVLLAGIYRFVLRSIEAEIKAQQKGKKGPIGVIGQGAILYQGGNWFFRGADALRTADDLGRFRLQYALGMPLFGVHGSFIVIRGVDDAELSFDVGAPNSITEDAAWALRAWAQGFRFAWVEGYLREQPPQRVSDFIKQRSRWLSGIRLVLCDSKIPFRYRFCLVMFTILWQLAFLPFLVAALALFIHAAPFLWMRLPADFAWATFVLAYLQGIDVQTTHADYMLQGNRKEQQWKRCMRRILSWSFVLCYFWYALMEAAAVLYSLRPRQGFFVINKSSFAPKSAALPEPSLLKTPRRFLSI